MDAFEIAWNRDETLMVLGSPSGMVRIYEVAADGGPGRKVAEVGHHRACIVHASFAGDRVVTMDADGRWALCEAATGEVVRGGAVDGEYVAADVDPTGATLFAFAYDDDTPKVRAIALASGVATEGPDVHALLSIDSRVVALDPRRAAFQVVRAGDHGVQRARVRRLRVGRSPAAAVRQRALHHVRRRAGRAVRRPGRQTRRP
ncbi:MAG: hypothetical protein ABMA64_12230 [Myxococcota bacterium]